MEGHLVLKKVRAAAKRLHEYLSTDGADYSYEECCEKLLKTISSAPIARRKANPNVVLRYEYDSYRSGSFKEKYTCTLASYILINALYAATGDGGFVYNDRVGKHSSVEVNPDEFEVEWTIEGVPDKDKGDWSWLKSNNFELHADGRTMLWEACLEWLHSIKPEGFHIEEDDIPDYNAFVPTFEQLYERMPYIVSLTFADAYKTFHPVAEHYGYVEKEQMRSHTIDFMDARIAAVFYVLQPTFEVQVVIRDSNGVGTRKPILIDPSKHAISVVCHNDVTKVDSHPWVPPPEIPWQTWPRVETWDELVERARIAKK